MEKDTIIKSLDLFNEKARRLERLSFVEIVSQGYGVTIAWDAEKGETYKNQSPVVRGSPLYLQYNLI